MSTATSGATRWKMGLIGVIATFALPALAIDYEARLSGVLAGSLSRYSSDATGKERGGDNNASFAGLSLAAAQSGYRVFAIYQHGAERFNESVPNTEAGDFQREFFGGVSSPFGTLGYGRQASFYRRAGQDVDPFHDTSVVGFNGIFAAEGASYGLSNLTNGFNDETLAYASPSYGGLVVHGSWFINNSPGQGDDDDDYGAGLRYEPEETGLSIGVEYLDGHGGDVVFGVGKRVPYEALRVHGSFRWDALSLGASFEQVDVENESDARKYGLLSASYVVLPQLTLAASVGLLEDVVPNAAAHPDGINGEGLTIGAFYEISPSLTSYVAARGVQLDSGADSETIAMGASYRFEHDLLN